MLPKNRDKISKNNGIIHNILIIKGKIFLKNRYSIKK